MHKEITNFDKWFVRQLLRSCNILGTVSEFVNPDKGKPSGTSFSIDLINLLTIQEEDILKHLTEVVNWENPKEAQAYSIFEASYHKTIDGRIRAPVHVPSMYSYMLLLWLVAGTTSTDTSAYQDENSVWTSRRAREVFQKASAHINGLQKPQ